MENVGPVQVSSRVQRFSFASFGEEGKLEDQVPVAQTSVIEEKRAYEPALPPVPEHKITEEELTKARQDGHSQGYSEGVAVGEAKVEKDSVKREEDIKAILELLANRLIIASEGHASTIAGHLDTMKHLTMAIARKVAGDALKSEPYEIVESTLRECLALMIGQPRIVVTVSPVLVAGLKQRIDALRPLLPGFEGELVVEESEAVSENDCRVEWKGGYAGRDTTKLWNDIENVIARTSMNKR